MPNVTLTQALRNEYQSLFDTCQIDTSRAALVEKLATQLIGNKPRYASVAAPFSIPWYVLAVIHNMEASQNFKCHLHNGDPLTARTVQVPAGRPKTGTPPFTWEQSAADAIVVDGLDRWNDWSISGMLYKLEGFNGWGYRLFHPEVKSPYLWSFTSHYTSGKYVKDGIWSHTARSEQCGAAALLRRLAERGEMKLESHVPDAALEAAMRTRSAVLRYAPNVESPGGIELQQFLNQYPGIFLKEDGKLGPRTSDAYKVIFGRYLIGDPRT